MFTVISVEIYFLILRRVVLVAEQDIDVSVVKFGWKWSRYGGDYLKPYAKPVLLTAGEQLQAIVLWSPIWRVGARLSTNTVLERI